MGLNPLRGFSVALRVLRVSTWSWDSFAPYDTCIVILSIDKPPLLVANARVTLLRSAL